MEYSYTSRCEGRKEVRGDFFCFVSLYVLEFSVADEERERGEAAEYGHKIMVENWQTRLRSVMEVEK